ncbi:alpha/beta hydrolase [Pseudonocardia petroleophila]|uniref:Alpha/beta hydrolase n=1 Tax=Pseudonocardia petroleophila TaxID=37331 RepID=A0A7G7MHT9_9PSEU|nr:alpha/beta hydrolase [Pseudonocardia petroleophila]QNG52350.1 alpha/beta hydrolase [Pseudonocardia petroleophila]
MPTFHHDLRLGRFIPPLSFGPRTVALARRLPVRTPPAPDDVEISDVTAPGVSLRLHRPRSLRGTAPALLWSHGGGYLVGSPEQDEAGSVAFACELGITVAAIRYRLAPEHPAPAAVEDAHAALRWLADQPGVDPERIAIGGASAGGGLTAALAQCAHDRAAVRPAFQLLVYPMLDDRTVLRTDVDTRGVRVWTPRSNRYGWTSYLGREPGSADVPPYAAPARRSDLAGLPPAWIGVGTLDLFHDEDLAYADRLEAAGVPCERHVVPGAFHGFDALFADRPVARAFRAEQVRVLRAALFT